jgi:hypothetical protein
MGQAANVTPESLGVLCGGARWTFDVYARPGRLGDVTAIVDDPLEM